MANQQGEFEKARGWAVAGGAAALLAAVLATAGFRVRAQQRKAPSGAVPLGEAERRKRNSERRLQSEGVPAIDHLPVIETASEARLRSPGAVADRLLALVLVAVKAEGLLSGESAESIRETLEGAVRERKA